MFRLVPMLGLIAILVGADRVAAQDTTAALTPIRYGDGVRGALPLDARRLPDQSRFTAFALDGRAGDSVTVWLVSQDFNANLLLMDAAGSVLASDDNGAGDCNARLFAVLPADAQYVIVANAVEPGEFGTFELNVTDGSPAAPTQESCHGYVGLAGVVPVGDSAGGALGDSARALPSGLQFEVWQIENPRGEAFTVDVVSSAFDAAAILVRGLREVVGSDDDGAGGCNARIAYAPDDQRPYRIVVVSRDAGRGGAYHVRVQRGNYPTLTAPPCATGGG